MAQLFTLPLPTRDEPNVTQTTSLEGRPYVFTFDWNSRTNRWTFALATESGTRILDGALLCIGFDLLRTVPNTLDFVPPGSLYLVGPDDPTLETIGDCDLLYLTSE